MLQYYCVNVHVKPMHNPQYYAAAYLSNTLISGEKRVPMV